MSSGWDIGFQSSAFLAHYTPKLRHFYSFYFPYYLVVSIFLNFSLKARRNLGCRLSNYCLLYQHHSCFIGLVLSGFFIVSWTFLLRHRLVSQSPLIVSVPAPVVPRPFQTLFRPQNHMQLGLGLIKTPTRVCSPQPPPLRFNPMIRIRAWRVVRGHWQPCPRRSGQPNPWSLPRLPILPWPQTAAILPRFGSLGLMPRPQAFWLLVLFRI